MSGPRRLSLKVAVRLDALPEALAAIEAFCRAEGAPDAAVRRLRLALDEAMTNVVAHGGPAAAEGPIEVLIRIDAELIEAELSDVGHAFDPLSLPPPDLAADVAERGVGGLGVHLIRTLMDHVAYRREAGRNVLTLRKRF